MISGYVDALESLTRFEDAVTRNDGAESMKRHLRDFLNALDTATQAAQDQDQDLPVPREILLQTTDWDAVAIGQMERALAEHDKLRHRQRHMLDLASLVEAALATT